MNEKIWISLSVIIVIIEILIALRIIKSHKNVAFKIAGLVGIGGLLITLLLFTILLPELFIKGFIMSLLLGVASFLAVTIMQKTGHINYVDELVIENRDSLFWRILDSETLLRIAYTLLVIVIIAYSYFAFFGCL